MLIQLVVGHGHQVFHQRLEQVEPGPGPVDHEVAVGVFKLPELQRHLIGDLVLGDRLAVPIHDLAAGSGDFQRDRAGVLAGDDRPVRSAARGGGIGRSIGSRGIGSSLCLGVTDKETSALAGPGADEDGSARASAVGNRKIST